MVGGSEEDIRRERGGEKWMREVETVKRKGGEKNG